MRQREHAVGSAWSETGMYGRSLRGNREISRPTTGLEPSGARREGDEPKPAMLAEPRAGGYGDTLLNPHMLSDEPLRLVVR